MRHESAQRKGREEFFLIVEAGQTNLFQAAFVHSVSWQAGSLTAKGKSKAMEASQGFVFLSSFKKILLHKT
jgi:hypothetical protein